eukprot:CAMPEP_0117660316 /NCGR_PEP_ID=MMETSP0804-20121206/6904_1 /TAXON_ID=1074897 /ORGANISM="Tetraselmis astigmatica, Strain CCMP880" /LENGTH=586 /DNA_ID=CAMNT_0005467039 /DNA_START=134 /DNA_END=1891 /DNA_ORIENTATION=+
MATGGEEKRQQQEEAPQRGPDEGHEDRQRTDEIIADASSFSELLLPNHLVVALQRAGYSRPSPVQYKAIPLARLGADLIVQAKSGTGKTLVFCVAVLENVVAETLTPQAIIVAPTREIALQSCEVMNRLIDGTDAALLKCSPFMGGQPVTEDEKRLRRTCQIAVGTPGRLCALMESKRMPLDTVRMLVLDEADQLLGDSFKEDITWLKGQLPETNMQTMALSATFTPDMLELLESWMSSPQHVMLCNETVSLKGVKHYSVVLSDSSGDGTKLLTKAEILSQKLDSLLNLLGGMTFHQAVVFCNRREQGEWLAEKLTAAAFPAVYISGGRPQEERTLAISAVRNLKRRVLVSSDLTARGVDLEHVTLVVNLDLPHEAATLLHRIGRTGRWGSYGVAVTYCVGEEELEELRSFIHEAGGGDLEPLPEQVPDSLYRYELKDEVEKVQFQQLLEAPVLPDPDGYTEGHAVEEGGDGDGGWWSGPVAGDDGSAEWMPYWCGQQAAGSPTQGAHSNAYQSPECHAGAAGTQAGQGNLKGGAGYTGAQPGGQQAEPAPASSWEEYLEQYSQYSDDYRRWVWGYYDWREHYRQW